MIETVEMLKRLVVLSSRGEDKDWYATHAHQVFEYWNALRRHVMKEKDSDA